MRCINNFNENNAPDFDRQSTLPARLVREAGYQTKAIGKMHFAPSRSRNGFEHVTLHPDDYIWWLEDHGYGGAFRGQGLGGNEVYPGVAITPDKYYHTTWSIDESIRFLDQRDPEMPFMLYLVFEAPHSPFDPPPPYDRMYDNFTISDPVKGDWVDDDLPAMFQKREVIYNWDDLTPEIIRESRRRYYGQISQIDYHLGRLFGSLKTHGVDRDTAIIFTSDHGECLGDHGLFTKHSFLESAARVPLIFRPPANDSRFDRSVLDGTPVQTADICPTLFDMIGIEQDETAEGQSLIPLMNPAIDVSDDRYIYGEVPGSAAVYKDELKYIFYKEGGVEQLFNIQADPDDMNNLVSDPRFTNELTELRDALIKYLEKNKSDLVADGKLITSEGDFDSKKLRSLNPLACRGPMRGGSGY